MSLQMRKKEVLLSGIHNHQNYPLDVIQRLKTKNATKNYSSQDLPKIPKNINKSHTIYLLNAKEHFEYRVDRSDR